MTSNLSEELLYNIQNIIDKIDLANWYKQYSWGQDTWDNGFPDIMSLEVQFSNGVKEGHLKREHVFLVANWGRLRNPKRINCPDVISLGQSSKSPIKDSINLLQVLKTNITGMGPTYLSKILRFAFPSVFGAIDTRLVRVFGFGDVNLSNHSWLKLKVLNAGYGWYIPENQAAWPTEYGVWIQILLYIANSLNDNGVKCPHPSFFTTEGLRNEGLWTSADVEMALFSYASNIVTSKRKGAATSNRLQYKAPTCD